MKKLNHTLLKTVAMFTILFMVACSNDDDTTATDAFVGNWKAIGYMEGDEYINIEEDECESGEMIVKDDFTGSIISHDCDFGDETENFTWINSPENGYYITIDSNTSSVILTFEDDKMTLSFGDDSEYTVFKRQ